jgi:hypothetical protein
MVDLRSEDIDAMFFQKIYILFQEFFSDNFMNMEEIYNYFKDASFDMESQTLPILMNKFLYLCCKGNGWRFDNYIALRKEITHRISIWRRQFYKDLELPLQGYDERTYLNSLNLILALQVKLFMCDS